MDNEIPTSGSGRWTITSFADVERVGRENPVDANLPLSTDVAVIMYTSGSTGLPKVRSVYFGFWFFCSLIDFVGKNMLMFCGSVVSMMLSLRYAKWQRLGFHC